jgi:hypothetical protein
MEKQCFASVETLTFEIVVVEVSQCRFETMECGALQTFAYILVPEIFSITLASANLM